MICLLYPPWNTAHYQTLHPPYPLYILNPPFLFISTTVPTQPSLSHHHPPPGQLPDVSSSTIHHLNPFSTQQPLRSLEDVNQIPRSYLTPLNGVLLHIKHKLCSLYNLLIRDSLWLCPCHSLLSALTDCVGGFQDHSQVQWFTRRTHRTLNTCWTHGYGLLQQKIQIKITEGKMHISQSPGETSSELPVLSHWSHVNST